MALTFNVMENDVLRPLFLKAQKESEKKGLLEGEKKGEKKEAAKILLRQLTRRFGDLASWVHERVKAADLETLEQWTDRVLDARSLNDVIGPNPVQ